MVDVLVSLLIVSANPAATKAKAAVPIGIPFGTDDSGGSYWQERELVVWRSRKDLPKWLRRHIQGSFDFEKEMVAGSSAEVAAGVPVRLSRVAPISVEGKLVIEERPAALDCHCTGVYRPRNEIGVKVASVVVWIVPHRNTPVVLRTLWHVCPPCLAP